MFEASDLVPDLNVRKMTTCVSCHRKSFISSRPAFKRRITEEVLSIDTKFQSLMKEVPQTMKVFRDFETDEVIDFIPPAAPTLPEPDPRDTHLPQFQRTETHVWREFLEEKLQYLITNRSVWIKGNDMKQILIHLFGAKEHDFDDLANACDNMNHDPALKYRKVANCRLGLDMVQGVARRLERAPYVLGFNEGFKRHDSGQYRYNLKLKTYKKYLTQPKI